VWRFNAAAFSGITTGAGETAEAVKMFLQDPIAYISALTEILDMIKNLDKIPAAIEQQQDLNNPFDENDDPNQYDSYREGWYTGYVVYLALESLVPASKLTDAVKTPNRLSNLADRLEGSRVQKAVDRVHSLHKAGKAGISKTKVRAIGTLSRSKGLTVEEARKVLRFTSSALVNDFRCIGKELVGLTERLGTVLYSRIVFITPVLTDSNSFEFHRQGEQRTEPINRRLMDH
jgi:hypothetical protein